MNHNFFMGRRSLIFLFLLLPSLLTAQSMGPSAAAEAAPVMPYVPPAASADPTSGPTSILATPVLLPRMSADLALAAYQKQSSRQSQSLTGYSAATLIRAELPGSSQRGEFELERHYTAPHTLAFKPVRYLGDTFVKTNVITRLLQSEVDHVQKDDPSSTALRPENYKFSHKGTTQVAGRTVHVFQVKPRQKRPGLFKGQIYLDAYSGTLVRVEGRVVKSPSLFVKKIEFVQDYANINGFTLPVRMHSEAKAALVGRTVVDIENCNYQPIPAPLEASAASGSY